jgi:D-3-phosphoglycerate dehydrogenase
MYRILISDKLSPEGVKVFTDEPDFQVDIKTGLKAEELAKVIGEYDALVVRSDTQVTNGVIAAASRMKVVGRAGVGLDNIDIPAATRAGIIVMNTPDGNTISAAEHTMAMLLSLARNIPDANASLKSGKWERAKFMGVELYGKTLGIIGLGRIGTEVAKRAASFGMNIIAYDPFASEDKARTLGAKLTDLETLIRTSDFITPHAPKTKETAKLIGEKELSIMKKSVRLVNVARGGIYDEAALAKALESGQIAGAALDVFETEPPLGSPLLSAPNIIVTPHLGASTEEAQVNVAIALAKQIVSALKYNSIANAVNIPAIGADEWKEIAPHFALAEKLGSFAAQISAAHVSSVRISYAGDVTKMKMNALTLAILKELLTASYSESVNLVNAKLLADELGMQVTETTSSDASNFTSLIRVSVTKENETHTLAGTVSALGGPRITDIDGHRIDIEPHGNLILFFNRDVPGILAKVSAILGGANINIAGLTNGRIAPGSDAVTIVGVDNEISEEVLAKISAIEGLRNVRVIKL